LTSVGLGVGKMPVEEIGKAGDECVNCEKVSNCFLEVIMGW